ncbi:hypothetical protein AVEN_205829-1, partial [Araneus ventricosus]
MPVQPT